MKNKAKTRVLGHSSAQRVPGDGRPLSPHPLTLENWVFSQYSSNSFLKAVEPLYSKVHCRCSNSPFLFPLPPASFADSQLVMSVSIKDIMLLRF
uniref:MSTP083 n=1 Tax=Homo sapiens TaxID=9606 RepID=Q7Z4F4_HUMAN|nr:MSTP083 [Homo sapiens]